MKIFALITGLTLSIICSGQNYPGQSFWTAFDGPPIANGGTLYNQNGIRLIFKIFEGPDPWGYTEDICEFNSPPELDDEIWANGKVIKYYRIKFKIENLNPDKQVEFHHFPAISFDVENMGEPIAHICHNNTGSSIYASTNIVKMGANSASEVDDDGNGSWFFSKPKITRWKLGDYTLSPDPQIIKQQTTQQYNNYISQADALLNAGDYEGALVYYKMASKLSPNKNYPKHKINEIEEYLAQLQNELENELNDVTSELEREFEIEINESSLDLEDLTGSLAKEAEDIVGSPPSEKNEFNSTNYDASICNTLKNKASSLLSNLNQLSNPSNINDNYLNIVEQKTSEIESFNTMYLEAVKSEKLDPDCSEEISAMMERFYDQQMIKVENQIQNLNSEINKPPPTSKSNFMNFAPATMTPTFNKKSTPSMKGDKFSRGKLKTGNNSGIIPPKK